MHTTLKVLTVAAATILLAEPALARGARDHVMGDYRQWGTPHAHVTITGTEQKTLVHKQSAGHYSVCASGSHALEVSYDANAMDVQAGDCVGVEASKISVKGKDASGFHRAFIYNHTHFHHHPGR